MAKKLTPTGHDFSDRRPFVENFGQPDHARRQSHTHEAADYSRSSDFPVKPR